MNSADTSTRTVQLDFALVGGRGLEIDLDAGRSYLNRERTIVEVRETDSLQSAYELARSSFGLPETDWPFVVAFFRGDLTESVPLFNPAVLTLTIAGVDGIANWHLEPRTVTLLDLQRSHRAGLLDGDPMRPYLIVDPHAGMAGPVPGDWDGLISALEVAVFVSGSIDLAARFGRIGVRGTQALSRAVEIWRRSLKASRRESDSFAARGADALDLSISIQLQNRLRIVDFLKWADVDSVARAADILGIAGYEVEANQKFATPIVEPLEAQILDLPMQLSDPTAPSDRTELAEDFLEMLADVLLANDELEPNA